MRKYKFRKLYMPLMLISSKGTLFFELGFWLVGWENIVEQPTQPLSQSEHG